MGWLGLLVELSRLQLLLQEARRVSEAPDALPQLVSGEGSRRVVRVLAVQRLHDAERWLCVDKVSCQIVPLHGRTTFLSVFVFGRGLHAGLRSTHPDAQRTNGRAPRVASTTLVARAVRCGDPPVIPCSFCLGLHGNLDRMGGFLLSSRHASN